MPPSGECRTFSPLTLCVLLDLLKPHVTYRASELLLAIPPERRRRTKREDQTVNNNVTIQENVNVNGVESPEVLEAVWEEDEQDLLAASRALAEAKEYMRASKLLLDCKSARGRFMRWYFDFLVCLILSSPF